MKPSSRKSVKPGVSKKLSEFTRIANDAMRKAARQVAAENKRLGLSLIVAKTND
jgi:hypothetical protein